MFQIMHWNNMDVTYSIFQISGQKFAILEEKVLLSSIFRNYGVQSTQARDELNPFFELMLRPADGIEVVLTRRKAM